MWYRFRLDGFGNGNQPWVNLDGYATLAPVVDGRLHAYAQLFRSGAMEGVTTVGEDNNTKRHFIASPTFGEGHGDAPNEIADRNT
jgi:hypothetical protein